VLSHKVRLVQVWQKLAIVWTGVLVTQALLKNALLLSEYWRGCLPQLPPLQLGMLE
jgi:hypothetical protein